MTLAEQKKYLLKEINRAMTNAPTEAEVLRVKTSDEMRDFEAKRLPMSNKITNERVTIRIPGITTTYQIYNTQEALKAFAKEARKGLIGRMSPRTTEILDEVIL